LLKSALISRQAPIEVGSTLGLQDYIDEDHRSFGRPQSWSDDKRGIGGELLIADLLATQVDARPGGSALFLGLDLGARGKVYPHIEEDPRCEIRGFGGDIDIALFLREYQEESPRYESSRRRLTQDHLVLIDSKQYKKDWGRNRRTQFRQAEEKLEWFRRTLSHPRLLGGGSSGPSLQLSYHFAHTGSWVPDSWLRKVGSGSDEQVAPNHQWWNSSADLVFESPVEVLLGQLSVLLTFANPEYRKWVPNALWSLLAPHDQKPYSPG
jgi:hypothetical protein